MPSFQLLHDILFLLLCLFASPSVQSAIPQRITHDALLKRSPNHGSALNIFQVYQPVLIPTGNKNRYGCVHKMRLMEHDFAYSYGKPFVGSYKPPPCTFNRVSMEFTATSQGRQFDRLAIMYLGDIEVWRTSTAEPTPGGIVWSYSKEMHHYNALWKQEQKIIFDLGNLVNDEYTGVFHTKLTATFFTVPHSPDTADTILPISARKSGSNEPSVINLPDNKPAAVDHSFPKNVRRAVVSLSACGQASEEFWFTNFFSTQKDTFKNSTGPQNGGGPWREVQLLIDGQLAGVHWPFPVVFTGGLFNILGVSPGFWQPIVGIDTFDLREHEIDVTPWLPLLLDDKPHKFEIRVASLNDDGANHMTVNPETGSNWPVTGKIFLFLDDQTSVTTGDKPVISTPDPVFTASSSTAKNATGTNDQLKYDLTATREISITSKIKTSSGTQTATWSQKLSYTYHNTLTGQGQMQSMEQSTTGTDTSQGYTNTYSYPLKISSSFERFQGDSAQIKGAVTQGLDWNVHGHSVFPSGIRTFDLKSPSYFTPGGRSPSNGYPSMLGFRAPDNLPKFVGAHLTNRLAATADLRTDVDGRGSRSTGTTDETFSFRGEERDSGEGLARELYTRRVEAVNGGVVFDNQDMVGNSFGNRTGEGGEDWRGGGDGRLRRLGRGGQGGGGQGGQGGGIGGDRRFSGIGSDWQGVERSYEE